MKWNAKKNYTHMHFQTSQPVIFPLKAKSTNVSHLNTSRNEICRLPFWRWNKTDSFREKLVLLWRSIEHVRIVWKFRPVKFSKEGWKKIWILNQLLREEVCWLKPWWKNSWQLLGWNPNLNEYQHELNEYSFFGYFASSSFRCREQNAIFGNRVALQD